MRAMVARRHGGPDVIELTDCDPPPAEPGQLVVDVAAAGVNYMDIYMREGMPPYAVPPPSRLGAEGAGVVAAAGPDVTGFAPGDRVAWTGVPGSYAEQAAVPAERAVAVPEGISLQTAAAVMLQGMTAHYLCSSTFPIEPGHTAVVHAGAGGVGLLLIQMIKMRGGTVIATTSTQAKAGLARKAGADHVAGYGDIGAVVEQVTGGAGAAVVYDGVGRTTFEGSLAALRPRGYMVLYGAASGPVPPFDLQRLAGSGSLFVTRPTLVHYMATREELLSRTGDLFSWISEGRLSVHVGGTYPLADAARAHDDLGARRTTGKLLLLPR